MGTAHANIWIRNVNCDLLTDVWRTDLVIRACTGSYLVNIFPEILDQLKKRYAKPASVTDITVYSSLTDQGGKTLGLQIGTAPVQNLVFTAPAVTVEQICAQMQAFFTDVNIKIVDGHIVIETKDRGPSATIAISGDCELVWGPIVQGSGYVIKTHYYQGDQRIMLMPPSGEHINHIEVDIPPGCYKVWTRVCHGANEETSIQMINVRCGEEVCVNLLLPQVKTCSAQVLHPAMDKIVYEQALADIDERLVAFRGLMYVAQIGKQDVLNQLAYRREEAVDKDDPELIARVDAVINLAQLLPDCY